MKTTTRKGKRTVESPQSADEALQVVDDQKFWRIYNATNKRLGPTSDRRFRTWWRFHKALCRVARRYGTVGSGPLLCQEQIHPDFYLTGDWFHHLTDGFGLNSVAGLSMKCLRKLQAVVADHHHLATLYMDCTDISPLDGLHVLVTATRIYVGWFRCSKEDCCKKMKAGGIDPGIGEIKRRGATLRAKKLPNRPPKA